MPLIELIGVSKLFSLPDIDVPALEDINLCVAAGEYVAIVGQSGSGKSTLLNILGSLDLPSTGQYFFNGQDTRALDADQLAALRREHFGFIFQRYNLLPGMSALENVALPAVYSGTDRFQRRERAAHLLSLFGLENRMQHLPTQLSGGQQQRTSIARALMNGAELIFADEPTGALDSESGASLLGLLRELNDAGKTIIVVTHDKSVAGQADRIIELRDGRIVSDVGEAGALRPRSTRASLVSSGGDLHRSVWGQIRTCFAEALHSALQSLAGTRLRTALSTLGISIGIASVVTILSLTLAVKDTISREVGELFTGVIPVWRGNSALPPGQQAKPFTQNDLDAIRAISGVKAVTVRRETQMEARSAFGAANVLVRGAQAQTLSERKQEVSSGRPFSPLDLERGNQVVLIDQRTQKDLFEREGSPIGRTLLIVPPPDGALRSNPSTTPEGIALPFTIVGIVSPEPGRLGNGPGSFGQILIPYATFTQKLKPADEVDSFNVLLDRTVPTIEVRKQLTYRLKSLHGLEDFDSVNPEEQLKQVENIANLLALLLAGVATISLFIGGVGVMNMMLVTVTERTREIGLRMAIGARQRDVRLQFLIESVVLCCVGGGVGFLISVAVTAVANGAQKTLILQTSWATFTMAFLVSCVAGLLSGALPARRAAALSPADALARE
jgi:macrolide transport system ATP-binding/permease protein